MSALEMTAYPLKRFVRLLLDVPNLRKEPGKWYALWRLIRTPRYQPGATRLCGAELRFVDAASFLSAYAAIFGQEIFKFRTDQREPHFIDCGANVGLSTVYLKRLYPNGTVLAFEPDPAIYQVLSANVRNLKLQGVELRNEAIWDSEAELSFYAEGADAGRLLPTGDASLPAIEVHAVPLRECLDRRVDFLKIDIEGAETRVLASCCDYLHNVDRLFVEYHSFEDQPQTLHTLINILADAGFRLQVHPGLTQPQPFMRQNAPGDLVMLLNIFAYRP